MCVLVVGVQWHAALPLVVAANRDEAYARPAGLPELQGLRRNAVLRPLDARAGGTWLGISAQGLLAVITNRRDGDFDVGRRSRGLLCRDILNLADTAAVEAHLAEFLGAAPCNSFNLLYADARRVCLTSWNGTLHTRELGPGTHVLSNEHGLGELCLAELAGQPPPEPAAGRRLLGAILASHAPRDERGFRICKHGGTYGTVSASLLFRDRTGRLWLEHAPGPPCRTPFRRYDLP